MMAKNNSEVSAPQMRGVCSTLFRPAVVNVGYLLCQDFKNTSSLPDS